MRESLSAQVQLTGCVLLTSLPLGGVTASSGMCGGTEQVASRTRSQSSELNNALLARLVDAHCHPTEPAGPPSTLDNVQLNKIVHVPRGVDLLGRPDSRFFAAGDEHKTRRSASDNRAPRSVPRQGNTLLRSVLNPVSAAATEICPGLHPWFVHALSLVPPSSRPSKESHYATLFPGSPERPTEPHPSLASLLPSFPSPVALQDFLGDLERHLIAYPSALLGEVGIDRAFRIPNIPGSPEFEKHALSSLATPLSHQLAVAEAQIDLAIRLRRNISFHSVRSAQETVTLLARLKKKNGFDRIHLCLHSFGGKPESINQIQKGASFCVSIPLYSALTATFPHSSYERLLLLRHARLRQESQISRPPAGR